MQPPASGRSRRAGCGSARGSGSASLAAGERGRRGRSRPRGLSFACECSQGRTLGQGSDHSKTAATVCLVGTFQKICSACSRRRGGNQSPRVPAGGSTPTPRGSARRPGAKLVIETIAAGRRCAPRSRAGLDRAKGAGSVEDRQQAPADGAGGGRPAQAAAPSRSTPTHAVPKELRSVQSDPAASRLRVGSQCVTLTETDHETDHTAPPHAEGPCPPCPRNRRRFRRATLRSARRRAERAEKPQPAHRPRLRRHAAHPAGRRLRRLRLRVRRGARAATPTGSGCTCWRRPSARWSATTTTSTRRSRTPRRSSGSGWTTRTGSSATSMA